jgi:hypothetical protein
VILLALTLSARLNAQLVDNRVAELSGPRFGVTYLSSGVVARLKGDVNIDVSPVITQFGWQVERRYASLPNGATPVTEVIFLAGGLEQNKFLPSVTGLIGFRTPTGVEFGVGPNLTPVSSSIAFAAGVTYRTGPLNVPFNLAIVPSDAGVRVSVLSGFNLRTR